MGEVISCTKKWFLTSFFGCCACVFVTAKMSIFHKHSKRKCRSTCTSIFNMGTWLSARFTHAACEKAEKWIKNKISCRKHSLPIAFLSCVCWGTKLAARLSTWVTSVSSTGRLNREDQFQGHTERRRRMCTFLTIFLGFYLLSYYSIWFATMSNSTSLSSP